MRFEFDRETCVISNSFEEKKAIIEQAIRDGYRVSTKPDNWESFPAVGVCSRQRMSKSLFYEDPSRLTLSGWRLSSTFSSSGDFTNVYTYEEWKAVVNSSVSLQVSLQNLDSLI